MSKIRINIKRIASYGILVTILIFLNGCQTLSSSSTTEIRKSKRFDMATLEVKLRKLDKWTASGVIGIRYNGKADSASYVYSQDGNDFSIKLYGPLGIGSIEIKGNSDKVLFIDNKGEETQADDVKSLMVQQLGWYVPVEGLKSWIKAIPMSDKDTNRQIDDNNLTEVLLERGWEIDYSGYKLFDGEYPLPTKIKMTRDGLYLKIIVKSWAIAK